MRRILRSVVVTISLALAGIFGPLFAAVAAEDSTKNISGDRSPEFLRLVGFSAEKSHPPDDDNNNWVSRFFHAHRCEGFSRWHQDGIASWYGPRFHGRKMANGKIYDMNALTVAHRFLPLGTPICIVNPANGRSVRAVVTDRGPYVGGRIIDLSRRIAAELGTLERGLGVVHIFLQEFSPYR